MAVLVSLLLGWVGNAKRTSFEMLQELLNVKAALRHRCASWLARVTLRGDQRSSGLCGSY